MTLEDSTQASVSSEWDMMRTVSSSLIEDVDNAKDSAGNDEVADDNNDDADTIHKEAEPGWDYVDDDIPKDIAGMN